MRRRSSVCCRSACLVLLASVMSRATFEMPMVAPEGDLIGEMLSETSTRLPSLRSRTVSLCSMLSPQPIRRSASCISGSRSSGTISVMFWPTASAARVSEQPLRGRIPAGDGAVERHRDDGVVGGFDRRAEQPLALGMMVARRFGAAMLLNLAVRARRSLHSTSLDRLRKRARQHAGLAARIDRNGGLARCWPPPRRLRSVARSAGSATARSAAPARPRTTPRSGRPEARCSGCSPPAP